MDPYSVDVIFTNRDRHADGSFVTFRSRVSVLADGDMDARQAAEQFVLATRCDFDPMVLSSAVVI